LEKRSFHLGLGDPDSASLLFIGVEQGGEHSELGEEEEDSQSEITQWDLNDRKKKWSYVWTAIAKSVRWLYHHNDYKKYMHSGLFRFGCHEVLVDLFPLAKPGKRKWPYDESISQIEYRNWLDENLESRYQRILAVHKNMANRIATICFGKGNWKDHVKCLGLENSHYRKLGDKRSELRVYAEENTILAPFFGNGCMPDKLLMSVISEIRKFE